MSMTPRRDLLVIVPSRARPHLVHRLAAAFERTCAIATDLVIAIDDDDPKLDEYKALGLPDLVIGPRRPISAITNDIALERLGGYEYLGQYSDDHVPVTKGWDAALTGEIDIIGGTGFAYCRGSRWVIPEGIVMSSDIVQALGWMSLPRVGHLKLDDAWLQLGLAAGCIRYRHDVIIDHRQFQIPIDMLNPQRGNKGWLDVTYAEAQQPELVHADEVGWLEWLADPDGYVADVAKIKAVIEAKS